MIDPWLELANMLLVVMGFCAALAAGGLIVETWIKWREK